jgi:CIC family chloride channel protein
MALGQLLPHLAGPAGAYGLVGMGAVFAAAARAPITAVLIVFELTGEYAIILPLMVAVVLAAGVSRLLTADTIYTLKLRRRGIQLRHDQPTSPMERLRVAAAMRPPPDPLPATAGLEELVARFAGEGERRDALPVVDDAGGLRGVVGAAEVEQAVQNRSRPTAGDLAAVTPVLRAEQTLEEALGLLLQHHGDGLPVLDGDGGDGGRVVGWVTHRDLLHAYAAARGGTPGSAAPPRHGAPRAGDGRRDEPSG